MNKELFKKLEDLDKKISMINDITQVLEYDLEVNAPKKASQERSKQLAWASLEAHKIASSDEMKNLLERLGATEENEEGFGESDYEKALIRERFKELQKALKIPEAHIEKKQEILTTSYEKWVEAREKDDFILFAPYLENVIECLKEEANYLKKPNQSLYDVLLNEYEPGITSEQLDSIFDQLETSLVPLVAKYKDKDVNTDFLYQNFDVKKQEIFSKQILREMGFDFDRGTLAIAVHPFTISLGGDDFRITTRYTDPNLCDPLCSTIHEGGHALYEMNAATKEIKGTSLGEGVSMGIHESQSRFWENIILKNPSFWDNRYEDLQSKFPNQLNNVSKKDFVKAINKVNPSYIRVNADEATYNLHIILRYKLEKQLIEGSLKVEDLPKAWNSLFEKYFSIKVDCESNGCLQDVHWASGLIGYFPTYALGNLYSAQLLNKIEQDFGNREIGDIIKSEGLGEISKWLDVNVHSKGRIYSPPVLLKQITNKALDGNYFTQYLEKKLEVIFD
jgi:carboxypeptidase Taq